MDGRFEWRVVPPPQKKKMREKGKKNKGIKNENQGGRVERVGYCLLRVPSDVLIELEIPLNVERKIACLYI